MNKPQLYCAYFSPPARACLLTAKMIGLELDLKLVDFAKKEHLSPDFLAMNPQHQVPVFVDTDGEIYIDSHAIICFMVSKYAKDDALYPKDLKIRAHVDHRLHFENGVLFQVLKDIVHKNLYGGEGDFHPTTVQNCHDAYAILETFFEKGDHVVGNSLTVADLSIISTMLTLNMLIIAERRDYPKLVSWMESLRKLPDYKKINEDGALALVSRINSVMVDNRERKLQ